jgi:hypothetical protein
MIRITPRGIVRSDTAWVRKQYHFWPGERGFDAWDVDRLVELSKPLPVRDVDLASIDEIDSVYWFDDQSQRPTVGTWWTTFG